MPENAPELTSTAAIPPGTRLGKYEVLKRLRSGGMAEIYVARSHGAAGVTQLVVIKRILPHLAEDPDFVQMFLNEARITASLDHPNIAHVKEVGDANGSLFLALEYVHGVDLRELLRTAAKADPIPIPAALAMVSICAEALDHAHARSIVHRDMSPSNVMVTYSGHLKVLDFGIAKALVTSKTRTGTIKGKVGYMSPEQCMAEDVDQRTDVFSLGVLLYELTLRRRLFKGDSDFAVMNQITLGRIAPPRDVDPGYPAALEAVVLKAIQVAPEKRYQTASAFSQALADFATAEGLRFGRQDVADWIGAVFPNPPLPVSDVEMSQARDHETRAMIPTRWTLPGKRSRRRGVTLGIGGAALGIALGAAVTGFLLQPGPEPEVATPVLASELGGEAPAQPQTDPPSPGPLPVENLAPPQDATPNLAAATEREPTKRRRKKKRKPKPARRSGSSLFPPSRSGRR